MTGHTPDILPAADVAVATAARRLGRGLLNRSVSAEIATEVAGRLQELVALVEQAPSRTKSEALALYPAHQRIEHFMTTGEWPPPPPDGREVQFDVLSFVGGDLNPFSAGVRYYRDGDDAVGVATFGSCHEGPPERVHGGMIASAFDEVMGAVFRVRGMPSSFTGTLSVRYVGPAPLGAELEFRARLASTEGRKHHVEATGTGPDGTFATATATFIEMSAEQFAAAIGADNHNGA